MAKPARKKQGILSDRRFDHLGDDVDGIASALREAAIAAREVSREGLLRSLAHPAEHDDDAFDDVVIDPAFVDGFIGDPARRALLEGAVEELRAWLDGDDPARAERALWTLVRLEGPSSALVARGLASPGRFRTVVLRALATPIAPDAELAALPTSLLPLLAPLLRSRAKKDALGDLDAVRLTATLLRVPSDEAAELLVSALERDDMRPAIARALAGREAVARLREPPGRVRERFATATDVIARARKGGLPDRREIAVAQALAALVERDHDMASRALSVFDLLPLSSPRTLDGRAKATDDAAGFAAFLARSVDLLAAEELEKLAGFLFVPAPGPHVAAAAAWVRLAPETAARFVRRFGEGAKADVDARWAAAAAAHLAWEGRSPAVEALLPDAALAAAGSVSAAPISSERLSSMVARARTSAELVAAVRAAAMRGERSALRPLLLRLRDATTKLDAELEDQMRALVTSSDEDLVRAEIDGENPFRDRREALARLLAGAGAGARP